MKTFFSFLSFTFLGIHILVAQQETTTRYANPEWDVLKGNPNTQLTVYSLNKKGKQLEALYTLDANGDLAEYYSYKKNGKEKAHVFNSFNAAHKQVKHLEYRNGRFRNARVYTYTNDTQLTKYQSFYKDSVTAKSTSLYTYTPAGKTQSIRTFNAKNKPTYSNEYDYYENGSRKESRFYKGSKLTARWTYDCKPEGELENQPSKTGNICKNRTYENDGSYTEITENVKKGKHFRYVVKAAADGRVLESSWYNHKGKLTTHFTFQYNAQGKLTQKVCYNKSSTRIKYTELYEYNQSNQLVASSRIDEDGQVKYKKEFSYN